MASLRLLCIKKNYLKIFKNLKSIKKIFFKKLKKFIKGGNNNLSSEQNKKNSPCHKIIGIKILHSFKNII